VATVAVGGADHLLLSAIVAYIGIDPRNDIEWVVANPNDWMEMFTADKVDAIFSFPPMNYELHANKVGHVILNTTTDDPWRHYFCCMIVGRREFIRNYPIATKRVLRAFYKAGQLCSLEPARTARSLIEQGFAVHYDYTLQTLQDVSYQTWRDHDPADTLRFYALRLYDVDLIQHTPQQIIDQGTDWRFLNELKQELKA
jgi:NitT/TauT family transport system substrate-binding protein